MTSKTFDLFKQPVRQNNNKERFVLVVEPDPTTRYCLSEILSSEEIAHRCCDSFEEATRILQSDRKVSLVVCSQTRSNLADELIAAMSENRIRENVPLLIMSGSGYEPNVRQIDIILRKPFSVECFTQKIEEANSLLLKD